MNTTTLIRVEHTDGFGMFRYNDDVDEPVRRYMIGDSKETNIIWEKHMNMPTPGNDGIGLCSADFCAFRTMKEFQVFTDKEEIKFLITQHDFKVLVLEVPNDKIKVGGHQSCYRKEDVVSTNDISSLFL